MNVELLSGTFITMAVNFLIMMIILVRILYRPLRQMLAERSQKIGNDLKEAQASREKFEQLESDAKSALQAAQVQASQILECARTEAEKIRAELLAKARQEADDLRQQHQAELERATRAAQSELRAGTVSVALLAVQKIIGSKMSPEINTALVQRTLDAIEKGGVN